VLGKARVWGRAPAPGATGRAVGGPLGLGEAGALGGPLGAGTGAEAEAEVTLRAGGLGDGRGPVLVALTWAAADEPAAHPVSSTAAHPVSSAAAANRVRKVATPASCRTLRLEFP